MVQFYQLGTVFHAPGADVNRFRSFAHRRHRFVRSAQRQRMLIDFGKLCFEAIVRTFQLPNMSRAKNDYLLYPIRLCRIILQFSILLTIVLIGELVLSGVIYHMRGDIEQYALNQMNHTMSVYNKTNEATTAWNVLQSDVSNIQFLMLVNYFLCLSIYFKSHLICIYFQIECCGINGPQDWKQITHNNELPSSCCSAIPVGGYCTAIDSYKVGCFVTLEKNLQENSQIIIWTAVGFAIVQVCCSNFLCI